MGLGLGSNFFTAATSTIDVAFTDKYGMATLIRCTAGNLPTDAGYAIGCLAEATDSGIIYYNSGTTAVASFTAVNAGAAALTLATALTDVGSAATTGNMLALTATGLTTGKALNVINGNTTNFIAGAALIQADLGTAVVGQGVNVVTTGIYTGTGLVKLTATAATTGVGQLISMAGLTSGKALSILAGTALTTGSLVYADMGAATAGNGLAIITSGVYTGTGLLTVSGAAATTGVLALITGTGLTSGTALKITAVEGTLTTGKYLEFYDGAANDFTVAKYGATVIAGNAATTVLTLTAGNEVITAGNLTLTLGNIITTAGTIINTPQAISNANTAISITHGVTTIANNAASTHALADGVPGQKKTIVCTVYTDDAVITPSNLANGTTITLNAVNDACDLVFLGTEWWVTNLYGTAAVA